MNVGLLCLIFGCANIIVSAKHDATNDMISKFRANSKKEIDDIDGDIEREENYDKKELPWNIEDKKTLKEKFLEGLILGVSGKSGASGSDKAFYKKGYYHAMFGFTFKKYGFGGMIDRDGIYAYGSMKAEKWLLLLGTRYSTNSLYNTTGWSGVKCLWHFKINNIVAVGASFAAAGTNVHGYVLTHLFNMYIKIDYKCIRVIVHRAIFGLFTNFDDMCTRDYERKSKFFYDSCPSVRNIVQVAYRKKLVDWFKTLHDKLYVSVSVAFDASQMQFDGLSISFDFGENDLNSVMSLHKSEVEMYENHSELIQEKLIECKPADQNIVWLFIREEERLAIVERYLKDRGEQMQQCMSIGVKIGKEMCGVSPIVDTFKKYQLLLKNPNDVKMGQVVYTDSECKDVFSLEPSTLTAIGKVLLDAGKAVKPNINARGDDGHTDVNSDRNAEPKGGKVENTAPSISDID